MENRDVELVRQLKDQATLSPKDRVFLARYKFRPKPSDFLKEMIEDPIYLRGDRAYGEDQSVICGIGKFEGQVVSFIASNKGHDLAENQAFNYGMIKAEGYRKAIRCMKEAEKFQRPLLCFVDTPGAYPGVEAEERGQAHAIAESIYTLTRLKCPIIALISGEGASGGAISLAVSDYLLLMENAIYSILSPEGFASILYKDAKKADYAKEVMKLEAKDLLEFGIADEVIPEDIAVNLEDFQANFDRVRQAIKVQLASLQKTSLEDLLKRRKAKFRRINH